MSTTFIPFSEPWQRTATRVILIALIIGAVTAVIRHQPALVLPIFLFALWFTFGGHLIELLFRNRIRQHLPASAPLQLAARLAWWFLGGALLYAGAVATTPALPRGFFGIRWWVAGLAFVAAEMLVHVSLAARGLASIYNGQG